MVTKEIWWKRRCYIKGRLYSTGWIHDHPLGGGSLDCLPVEWEAIVLNDKEIITVEPDGRVSLYRKDEQAEQAAAGKI